MTPEDKRMEDEGEAGKAPLGMSDQRHSAKSRRGKKDRLMQDNGTYIYT